MMLLLCCTGVPMQAALMLLADETHQPNPPPRPFPLGKERKASLTYDPRTVPTVGQVDKRIRSIYPFNKMGGQAGADGPFQY